MEKQQDLFADPQEEYKDGIRVGVIYALALSFFFDIAIIAGVIALLK